MVAKTDKEIKDDISISYANNILAATVSTRDNLVKSLTVISSISIPSYIALIKIFNTTIQECLFIKILPILLFSISLIFCFILYLPRSFNVDYQNPIKIIEDYSERLKDTKTFAIITCLTTILGVFSMAYVFLK
jgi:hypothetical protein